MSSGASLLFASLVVALAGALGACSGNAVATSMAVVPEAGGGGGASYSPEAGALEVSEAGAAETAPAAAYQGNPLCNASTATGCCYPDAVSICAPSACESPSDGGAADGTGFTSQVAYGCHLAAAPNPSTASDATSASVVQQVTPACTPAGIGLDGAPCQRPNDCAPGYECVGAEGACRHYCCAGTAACRIDQFCDIQQTSQGAAMSVPVCMPLRQCDLVQPATCPSGQTCAVVREDGATSCVATGTATAGQSCETEHCAAGFVCLGATVRTCYALCLMTDPGPCPAPQACKGGPPLFAEPSVGVCQSP